MATSRWSVLCVIGVMLFCVDAQSNQTGTIVPGANSSDVTTSVPSTTVSMDATSSTTPSSVNSTTSMPSSSNETSSSSTSGQGVAFVPQFVEQPPSFPPPPPPAQFNPAAADPVNAETTTPSTTPLTVVEVGNVAPTVQNDEKHKYDVNNFMPNDAPAESQPSTKDSMMGSTVSYSKDGPSKGAQQKPEKGSANTSQVYIPLLAISFLVAVLCNRM